MDKKDNKTKCAILMASLASYPADVDSQEAQVMWDGCGCGFGVSVMWMCGCVCGVCIM